MSAIERAPTGGRSSPRDTIPRVCDGERMRARFASLRAVVGALVSAPGVLVAANFAACTSSVDDVSISIVGPVHASPFDVQPGVKPVASVSLRVRSSAGTEAQIA